MRVRSESISRTTCDPVAPALNAWSWWRSRTMRSAPWFNPQAVRFARLHIITAGLVLVAVLMVPGYAGEETQPEQRTRVPADPL